MMFKGERERDKEIQIARLKERTKERHQERKKLSEQEATTAPGVGQLDQIKKAL